MEIAHSELLCFYFCGRPHTATITIPHSVYPWGLWVWRLNSLRRHTAIAMVPLASNLLGSLIGLGLRKHLFVASVLGLQKVERGWRQRPPKYE
jgi:hypothetical protein